MSDRRPSGAKLGLNNAAGGKRKSTSGGAGAA